MKMVSPQTSQDAEATVQGISTDDGSDDDSLQRGQLAANWERARMAVFAQLLAGIGSFHDAEDLLQEVAISIAQNYGSYDPSRPFIAWALGITRNHMLMYFRRYHRSRVTFSNELMATMERHFVAAAEAPVDPRREALHRCIGRLDDRRRRLIELRYSGGFSIEKMAAVLGKSTVAIKGSLFRVRRFLEECVSRAVESVS
jgi:RNA polymerase sigma-70 factor (ECF subfamily)